MHKKNTNRLLRLFLTTAAALLLVLVVINSIPSILKMVYPLKYKEFVYKYSSQYKIDPYLAFSIIKAESGFDPDAVSRKDARGLMQITKGTGEWAAGKMDIEDFSVEKLHNPETNIQIGCWYIKWLMDYFGNNEPENTGANLDVIIAAYNSGSGTVRGWLKDKSISSTGNSLDRIPFRETDKFLKKVKGYRSMYKRLYENGF